MTLDGAEFPIAEPTRVAGVLAHESGVLTTITTTDDANGAGRYGVEVHGLDGTLLGGDPNTFDGPVILARRGELDETLQLVSQVERNARGLGLRGPLPRRPRRDAPARERRARAAGPRGRCWRSATCPKRRRIARGRRPHPPREHVLRVRDVLAGEPLGGVAVAGLIASRMCSCSSASLANCSGVICWA